VNKTLAPIIAFVYNRPDHALQCLKSLQENEFAKESTLYIFSDGKKPDASPEEIKKIEEIRKAIRSEKWCAEVIIKEQEENIGLAKSIINGVTEVINKHGKAIVLEDDLILSNHFLSYMNEGLDLYQGVENVYSINGYMFPLETSEQTTFLLPFTSTWGWATWKDRWSVFTSSVPLEDKLVLLNNPQLKTRFDLSDYDYTQMLHYNNNSWGIKWYYSVFLRNGLNVFPTVSLVANLGNDGSGTNCKKEELLNSFQKNNKVKIKVENTLDLYYLDKYFKLFTQPQKSKVTRLIQKIFN
jgi:hypothetical protein